MTILFVVLDAFFGEWLISCRATNTYRPLNADDADFKALLSDANKQAQLL